MDMRSNTIWCSKLKISIESEVRNFSLKNSAYISFAETHFPYKIIIWVWFKYAFDSIYFAVSEWSTQKLSYLIFSEVKSRGFYLYSSPHFDP